MKVTKSGEEHVRRITYQVEHEGHIYHFTDYLTPFGEVIDSELRDNNGHIVDDPVLFEQVENAVAELENA